MNPEFVYTNNIPFSKMESFVLESCVVLSGVLTQKLKRLLEDNFLTLKRRKRQWIRKWIEKQQTIDGSLFISQELRNEYLEDFKNILRMSDKNFEYLLNKVKFKI